MSEAEPQKPTSLTARLTERATAPSVVRPLAGVAALLVLPTIGVVTAFGIAPDTITDTIPRQNIVQQLDLPSALEEQEITGGPFVTQERILQGDTIAALFARLAIDDSAALDFVRTDKRARPLLTLKPGRTVQAWTTEDGDLQRLRYLNGGNSLVEMLRDGDTFRVFERTLAAAQLVSRSGTIQSSLFAATDRAGIPDAVAIELAKVFATEIDFHIDLRKGDTFSVTWEAFYEGGDLLATGRVVAAEFVNKGTVHSAILFADGEGGESYYTADGKNTRKGFLRSPVEFSRISSGFGGRIHPIFRNWREHRGVDFAAPRGTRVLAASDGTVVFAGTQRGYGNVLEIRHPNNISTLYAHLNGFADGVLPGTKVKQGEVIAFVGSTGYSTGPHLHYEFKIAGEHVDPLTVNLPPAAPITAELKPKFDSFAKSAAARLILATHFRPAQFE